MRYFIHIAYRGTRYSGWQRQPEQPSIQRSLEETLSSIFNTSISIHGCGRTDTGVHASQYFFHVDLKEPYSFDLKFRCNHVLPDDIVIFDIIPVKGLPHARFDAIQRKYEYYIHTYKDPFLTDFSSLVADNELDINKMMQAVLLLPKYNDYRAFCKSPDKNEHTICHVSAAALYINTAGNRIRFDISSNRFLGRMIRILVRKLIEIGNGTISVEEFEWHLKHKETPASIIPASPNGLFLAKVTYPFLDFPIRTEYFKTALERESYWQAVKIQD